MRGPQTEPKNATLLRLYISLKHRLPHCHYKSLCNDSCGLAGVWIEVLSVIDGRSYCLLCSLGAPTAAGRAILMIPWLHSKSASG